MTDCRRLAVSCDVCAARAERSCRCAPCCAAPRRRSHAPACNLVPGQRAMGGQRPRPTRPIRESWRPRVL